MVGLHFAPHRRSGRGYVAAAAVPPPSGPPPGGAGRHRVEAVGGIENACGEGVGFRLLWRRCDQAHHDAPGHARASITAPARGVRGQGDQSAVFKGPPIRCWSAARLGGQKCCSGAPRAAVARDGPSGARASSSAAGCWRGAAPARPGPCAGRLHAQVTRVGQIARPHHARAAPAAQQAGHSWAGAPGARPGRRAFDLQVDAGWAEPVPLPVVAGSLAAGCAAARGDLNPAHRHDRAALVVVGPRWAREGGTCLSQRIDLRAARRPRAGESSSLPSSLDVEPAFCGQSHTPAATEPGACQVAVVAWASDSTCPHGAAVRSGSASECGGVRVALGTARRLAMVEFAPGATAGPEG